MFRLRKASKSSMIVAVLALAFNFTGTVRGSPPQGTLRFVAVGVSQYPTLPAKQQLLFAHKDAQDLAQAWHDQQGKLYKQVEGVTLIDKQATRRNVLAALAELIRKGQAGDTAMISLCGHAGSCGVRGEWGFLPSDYNAADGSNTALLAGTLRTKLTELAQRGVTVILILDCCHAGAFGIQNSEFVVFAACLPQEFSRESSGHGLFTRAFLEAIQGQADFNGDGLVSLAEVDAYVANWLERRARDGGEQNPSCSRPTSIRSSLPLAQIVAGNQQAIATP